MRLPTVFASALAVLYAAHSVQAQTGHVFICTEPNFQGECFDWQVEQGICYNLPSQWNDNISSIGPDQGWVCVFFIDYNCSPDSGSLEVYWPGASVLTYGDDEFSSFECWLN